MGKLKTRIMGILLAMGVLGGSAFSCYAATTSTDSLSLTLTTTKERVTARFDYGQKGHTLTVTVHYAEEDSGEHRQTGSASNTLAGDYSAVSVTTTGTTGYEFVWAYATGAVSGTVVAQTATDYLK